MRDIDVFNGDADGICALVQLRRDDPRRAELVTGPKREIDLLRRVQATDGDRVTVLDVAFEKNRDDVQRLLAQGTRIFYVDHHHAGEIPPHANLTTLINEAPEVCTSLLVNGRLRNRYVAWAVVGAYGDNLGQSAERLAQTAGLSAAQAALLERLGICINYNGYGESLADLIFAPDAIFTAAAGFDSPFDFINEAPAYFERLEGTYRQDRERAAAERIHAGDDGRAGIVMLPFEPWARRISGVYGNELANQWPERAHAVLTLKGNGCYVVSVRAPLALRKGADRLCRQFATGGGRAAAAGINDLPVSELGRFETMFFAHSWG